MDAKGPAGAARHDASDAPPGEAPGAGLVHSIELEAAAAALLGLTAASPFPDLLARVHADDRASLLDAVDTALETLGPVTLRLRATCHDGVPRTIRLRLRHAQGLLQFVTTDVSETAAASAEDPLARLREAQRRREQRLALAAVATRDVLWDWDVAGDTYWVSARLGELLGRDRIAMEMDAPAFAALLHPEDLAGEREARRRHLEHRERYDVDYRLRTAAGEYRWFRAVGETLRDERGTPLHMAGLISDVDAIKFAEHQLIEQRDALEAMTRQLQDMSLRLVRSQEDERRHVARELHDQTGQTLTAAVLDLEFWRGRGVPPDEIDRVLVEIKRALAEIRDISLRLRPPLLEEAGLEVALRSYLERQSAAVGFTSNFFAEGPLEQLSPEAAITAFRLIQESVTNIVRHAQARHVDVSLKLVGEEVVLRVSDDGSGCVAAEALSNAVAGSSLGLIGMNERAALLGGHCEFVSAPGVGSLVLARIPAERRAKPGAVGSG